jgi:hypothetical protein
MAHAAVSDGLFRRAIVLDAGVVLSNDRNAAPLRIAFFPAVEVSQDSFTALAEKPVRHGRKLRRCFDF